MGLGNLGFRGSSGVRGGTSENAVPTVISLVPSCPVFNSVIGVVSCGVPGVFSGATCSVFKKALNQ